MKFHSLKFRRSGRIKRLYCRRASAQSAGVRGTQADFAPQSETASADPLRILVVDDERRVRKLLRMGLKTQSYELLEASDGQTSLQLLSQDPDLIILDLGLPDIDGLELLREIRECKKVVPIIVLSERDSECTKAQAFNLGAKDYIAKPFAIEELLVRIRAVLRNQQHTSGERPILETERVSVDVVRHTVKIAGREVSLSQREYEVLRVLAQHAGKVLTPKFLLTELGEEVTNVQCLRVYVQKLRQKIEADPRQPRLLLQKFPHELECRLTVSPWLNEDI